MRWTEFLQDDNGSFSATRLAFLLWIVGVLAAWLWVSILNKSLQPINTDVQTIIGILMTGKVVQKFQEKSEPVISPPDSSRASQKS